MKPHGSVFETARRLRSNAVGLAGRMTGGSPWVRRALSFYPDAAWPTGERLSVLHRSSTVFPWMKREFEEERARVFANNVDRYAPSIWPHDGSAQRLVALVRDVIVPGHCVRAVDPGSGRVVDPDPSDIHDARLTGPSLSGMRSRLISSDPTAVIPRTRHFGRLVTDRLLPIMFALERLPPDLGKRINVVTCEAPGALVLAFVEALRLGGYVVTHVEARRRETLRVPLYLHASCQTRNRDNLFATPEALGPAWRQLSATLPGGALTIDRPRKIYLCGGKKSQRRILNEGALVEGLAALGFSTFEANWDNALEQLAAFRAADIVVAAHGGGLANILWARPGALLIEIMAQDARKSFGLHLASAAGASYRSLLGGDSLGEATFSIEPEQALAEIAGLVRTHEARRAG